MAPAGQELHGGLGSLKWGKDRHQRVPWMGLLGAGPQGISWQRSKKWHKQLPKALFTRPAQGTRVCMCMYIYIEGGI
jgi:hypothetical protein